MSSFGIIESYFEENNRTVTVSKRRMSLGDTCILLEFPDTGEHGKL